MKKWLFLLFLLTSGISAVYGQNQILGKWLSEDKEGITEIYREKDRY